MDFSQIGCSIRHASRKSMQTLHRYISSDILLRRRALHRLSYGILHTTQTLAQPMDAPGTFKQNIVPASRPKMPWQQALLRLDPPTAPREPLRRARKARERHKMVVYLHASGWKNKDIAEAMGYSQQQVSIIIQSKHPELLEVKEEAQKRVLDNSTDLLLRFRQESVKSLETLIHVRDNAQDDGQKRLAARDILDRAGYSVVRKQINLNADVPVQQLDAVLNRVHEAHQVEQEHPEWDVTNPQIKKEA